MSHDHSSSTRTDTKDSDALVVTATLNSLGTLVKTRASIANKIVSTVLNFNPLILAQSTPVTTKNKVMVRSMARTTMTFLKNIIAKYVMHTNVYIHPLADNLAGTPTILWLVGYNKAMSVSSTLFQKHLTKIVARGQQWLSQQMVCLT